jgi:hypothetical protein
MELGREFDASGSSSNDNEVQKTLDLLLHG